jgi:GLPGLI family protein
MLFDIGKGHKTLIMNIKSKKIKVLLFFTVTFFFNLKSISQENVLFVTYKKNSILSESKKIKDANQLKRVKNFDDEQNNELKNVEYYLTCNKSESLFKVQDILKKDNNRRKKLFIKLGGGGDIVYTNFKTKEQLWEKEAFGSLFLVSNNINAYKWQLQNKSKKIGKYTCYKAIGEKNIVVKGKNKKVELTAWYSPELNFPFGPAEYCNLPGLILEISDSNIKFVASKIEFNQIDKKYKISKPTKGEKVTLEELKIIGSKLILKQ